MEDLRRMMFDPLSPFEQLPEQHLSGYSLGRATGTGATPPGAQLAQFVPAGPHAQHAQHAAYMQPTAVVHSGGGYSVVPAALGPGAHPLLLPGVVHVRGEPHQVALHLGAQLEGAASSGLRRSLGSLGSMKRRVDGMGLSDSEADTLSPRGSKRHSSGSMWSEGSGENGGSAGTPRSQPGRLGGAVQQGRGLAHRPAPLPALQHLQLTSRLRSPAPPCSPATACGGRRPLPVRA